MVKKLDENPDFLLDHVGWRLWRANRAWQAEFAGGMRAALMEIVVDLVIGSSGD